MIRCFNTFAALLFTVVVASAQSFEGKIVYTNSYKSKMPNISDEQFTSMMGNVQEFFIKGNQYKSVMNGSLLQWQVYSPKDAKLYTKMSPSPAILWNDVTENLDEILKSEVNRGVITVLGYLCDELILTCKSGVQKFYFSDKIKLDPALFANHKFANWNEVMAKTRSLPLKMIVDNAQLSMESVATEVVKTDVDIKIFELPTGATFEKNPY